MKIQIINWYWDRVTEDALLEIGYEHKQIIEGDTLEIVKEIYTKTKLSIKTFNPIAQFFRMGKGVAFIPIFSITFGARYSFFNWGKKSSFSLWASRTIPVCSADSSTLSKRHLDIFSMLVSSLVEVVIKTSLTL